MAPNFVAYETELTQLAIAFIRKSEFSVSRNNEVPNEEHIVSVLQERQQWDER